MSAATSGFRPYRRWLTRVGADGSLLDETDTPADETDPAVNFPLDTSGDYSERPVVAYGPEAEVYLAAWNDRDDGGVYARRYAGAMPPTPEAGFTAVPTQGVVPLTVVFTDTSTGTIASREWNFGDGETLSTASSAPLSHTYVTTGSFSAVLTATNPAGSDVASTLITVTEQTTPFLVATFEDLELGVDPLFWRDQGEDTGDRDDFETLWAGDSRALGTGYSGSSAVYSHYAIPGWASWQDYEVTGRLKMSDAAGGIGVSFYSRYPAGGSGVYVLRRFDGTPEEDSFHLVAFDTTLTGDLQTGVTPQAETWYHFRIQAATEAERVTVRAKVWAEGSAEPGDWQVEAYDASAGRVTAGAVGVRTAGAGSKYFDDLVVRPLSSYRGQKLLVSQRCFR